MEAPHHQQMNCNTFFICHWCSVYSNSVRSRWVSRYLQWAPLTSSVILKLNWTKKKLIISATHHIISCQAFDDLISVWYPISPRICKNIWKCLQNQRTILSHLFLLRVHEIMNLQIQWKEIRPANPQITECSLHDKALPLPVRGTCVCVRKGVWIFRDQKYCITRCHV